MRKLIIICLLILSVNTMYAEEYKEFVIDKSNILTQENTEYININSTLLEAREIAFHVAIIKSTEGKDLDTYSYGLYKRLGLSGTHATTKSILITLSYEDEAYNIQTSPALSKDLTNESIKELVEIHLIPELTSDSTLEDSINAGITNLYRGISDELVKIYSIELTDGNTEENTNIEYKEIVKIMSIFISILVLAALFTKYLKYRQK